MKILLTNDDGIHAKGINELYDVLSKEHEVYVFAPHIEKSACSNAVTIYSTVTVEKHGSNKYAVHGFPADCVNIGLNGGIIPEDIDLVISGINHGPNLADDIYYSGTVAGARSAYIHGKSSLAVSLNSNKSVEFLPDVAEYVRNMIREGKLFNGRDRRFINLNYPALKKEEIKGSRFTKLGKRYYIDRYEIKHNDDKTMLLQLVGELDWADDKESDVTEIEKGYISITPLHLDTTDYETLRELNGRGLNG